MSAGGASPRCYWNGSSSAIPSRQVSAGSLPRIISVSSWNSGSSQPLKPRRAVIRCRPATWARLCAWADSAAALVDERLRPPCQADSDEGHGLMLDAPTLNRWPSMLALAEALVGRQDWWPRPSANAASSILGALAGSGRQIGGRPSQRPSRFPGAGITLLRTRGSNEIWCRCDGGSHRDRQTRCARPRGCSVRRSALRGRRHPDRPRHLLLPRRARMALIFPADDCAQRRRTRRPEPAWRRWFLHAGASRAYSRGRGTR